MPNVAIGYLLSPIGLIKIKAFDDAIVQIDFTDKKDKGEKSNPTINKAISQLEEYFDGKRKEFDLKLSLSGTEFQKIVWENLLKIPYGSVTSYKELAKKIGKPNAQRALGMAVGKNPIAIVIPCHRVIKKDGGIGGYAGGIDRKKWLLELERNIKIFQN